MRSQGLNKVQWGMMELKPLDRAQLGNKISIMFLTNDQEYLIHKPDEMCKPFQEYLVMLFGRGNGEDVGVTLRKF